ncbi:MAG: energy transducer TonB [Candidatus Krumholzibacteria bacterium]|nr:energy transducer TonB [Candidatus Krumholzibacteria bacterium]
MSIKPMKLTGACAPAAYRRSVIRLMSHVGLRFGLAEEGGFLKFLVSALLLVASAMSPCMAESLGSGFRPLTVVSQMPAYYTSAGRNMNIEGRIEIMAYVDSSGAVYKARVVSIRQRPTLERPAILATFLSRFEPAIRNGVAFQDSIVLSYSFRKDADEDSDHTTTTLPFQQLTVDLEPYQICLYGNWLSGEVQIRISEDRVYVDGIRVFPEIHHFDPELNPEFSFKSIVSHALRLECRYFERELALQGVSLDEIRSRSVDMLMGLRNVDSARIHGDHLLVRCCAGETYDLVLPDPRSAIEYFAEQGQMADPSEVFFKWAMDLHPSSSRPFIVFSGISSRMGLSHEVAVALRRYLQRSADESCVSETEEWPAELSELDSSLSDVVRRPLKVPRL